MHALNTPFAISFLSIIRREVYIPKQIHRDKLNKREESLFRKIIGAKNGDQFFHNMKLFTKKCFKGLKTT